MIQLPGRVVNLYGASHPVVQHTLPMNPWSLKRVPVFSASVNGFPTFQERTWVYGQKRPYNLVLPFRKEFGEASQSHYTGEYLGSSEYNAQTIMTANYSETLMQRARLAAYERLKGELMNQASLGVDLAEARSSLSMIAQTAGTLLRFTRAIKRFQFDDAADALRMQFMPKGVSKRKSAGSNWLAFWLGWSPLVGSVYDAIDVVNSPLKSFSAQKGRGFEFDHDYVRFDHPASFTGRETRWDSRYTSIVGGTVKQITDQNLFSLNQWGLLNPLTVAWELVPLSFVADWFVNVGSILEAQTDYAGMELVNTYYTDVYRVSASGFCFANPENLSVKNKQQGWDWPGVAWSANGGFVERRLGLPSLSFGLRSLKPPSKARAATAISLLLQALPR